MPVAPRPSILLRRLLRLDLHAGMQTVSFIASLSFSPCLRSAKWLKRLEVVVCTMACGPNEPEQASGKQCCISRIHADMQDSGGG